jgi:hypothetical protein
MTYFGWKADKRMCHVRNVRFHIQTKGKVERWHQTFKNRSLLESYFLPGDLEVRLAEFVEHYNYWRHQKSFIYRLANEPTCLYGLRVLALERLDGARTRQRPMPARVTLVGRSSWGFI